MVRGIVQKRTITGINGGIRGSGVSAGRARSVKFLTLGCKVNQYETQSIRERFLSRGFYPADERSEADVVVVNTCTVTAAADRKSRYEIKLARRKNPRSVVIVTGCMVKGQGVSPDSVAGADYMIAKGFFPDSISGFEGRSRAFIKVQDGCDNRCSYCKVCIVRGRSRSRMLEDILKEARVLVRSGFKELVLTGICLGAYGKDIGLKHGLLMLVNEMEKIKGLLRIRLSSIEAKDVSDPLIRKMAASGILCPHLHIPFQCADDKILRLMNRRYTVDDYRRTVLKIFELVPDFALSTDIIVGFPGETEINFQNTVKFITEISPLKVHIFPYSRREGTLSYGLKNAVPGHVVKERLKHLAMASSGSSAKFLSSFLGRRLRVLIENRSTEDSRRNLHEGYSENYIKVKGCLDTPAINKIVVFSIKKVYSNYVEGEE